MHFLDVTLETVAENLALDEALLLQAEEQGPEVLRLWEWPAHAVVLGAGGLLEEVDEAACRETHVPLERRSSGGGTVVLGPGCLLYSLVLSYERDRRLGDIRASFRWILERIAARFARDGIELRQAGISDLVLGDRKVSGNAQQRKRNHLLHHGTLLYRFDVSQVEKLLRMPARQPDYRRQRSHAEFLANLPCAREDLARLLREVWHADIESSTLPSGRIAELVHSRYSQSAWMRRR